MSDPGISVARMKILINTVNWLQVQVFWKIYKDNPDSPDYIDMSEGGAVTEDKTLLI